MMDGEKECFERSEVKMYLSFGSPIVNSGKYKLRYRGIIVVLTMTLDTRAAVKIAICGRRFGRR